MTDRMNKDDLICLMAASIYDRQLCDKYYSHENELRNCVNEAEDIYQEVDNRRSELDRPDLIQNVVVMADGEREVE